MVRLIPHNDPCSPQCKINFSLTLASSLIELIQLSEIIENIVAQGGGGVNLRTK
jgi:hypothetical protein